jgi:hypothetical protein
MRGLLVCSKVDPDANRGEPLMLRGSHTKTPLDKNAGEWQLPPQAALLITATLCAFGIVLIVAGYGRYAQAYDDPAHIACGMEWLDKGTYTLEPLHPPLARVAVALGPYLVGLRLPEVPILHDANGDSFEIYTAGNRILQADGRYKRNLMLARLGELPFFIVGVFVVFLWTRSLFGETSGVLAVFLFVTVPPILAFAGAAYTDLPISVLLAAALYAFTEWLEYPDPKHTTWLGITAGLAVLAKFTALLFLPACFVAILTCRFFLARRSEKLRIHVRALGMAAAALALSALVIWAGYRFSLQPLNQVYPNSYQDLARLGKLPGPVKRVAGTVIAMNPSLPAPSLLKGIASALRKNARAEPSYLFGRIRGGGWWYFFLVCVAVKTPIPFLLLSGAGTFWVWKLTQGAGNWRMLAPAASALAILIVTMPVEINLGTRHVLAVYPLLAPMAAYGVTRLAAIRVHGQQFGLAVTLILLLWQASSTARDHGDHFAYFNELAGKHPEEVLAFGCDLDCGQDLWQLSRALRERGVGHVSIALWTSADLSRMGLPPFETLQPYERRTGWIAASTRMVRTGPTGGPPDAFTWISSYTPVAPVGNTIDLYYIPPESRDRKP